MRLVLFQPEIPQNAGTLMRLTACLGIPLDIIEPCGFILNDKRLKRGAMDYRRGCDLTTHLSWDHFLQFSKQKPKRIALLTTHGQTAYTDFTFESGDALVLGQEGHGVPDAVHESCDHRIKIPLKESFRSLNVAVAGAMVLGEALRQLDGFPDV